MVFVKTVLHVDMYMCIDARFRIVPLSCIPLSIVLWQAVWKVLDISGRGTMLMRSLVVWGAGVYFGPSICACPCQSRCRRVTTTASLLSVGRQYTLFKLTKSGGVFRGEIPHADCEVHPISSWNYALERNRPFLMNLRIVVWIHVKYCRMLSTGSILLVREH